MKKKTLEIIFDSPEAGQEPSSHKKGVTFNEKLEDHLVRSSRRSLRESRGQSLRKSTHRKSKSYSSILKGIDALKINESNHKLLRIKVISIRTNIPTKFTVDQIIGEFPVSQIMEKPLNLGRGNKVDIRFAQDNNYVSKDE